VSELILAIENQALERFGRLSVISEASPHVTPNGTAFRVVSCRCECGRVKDIRWSELTRKDRKRTISCGCYRAQRNRQQVPPVMIVHGLCSRTVTHYLYTAWKGIKRRCFDRKCDFYYLYGERGITMHPEWVHNPAAFASYIITSIGERPSKRHSLDRTDNNGCYVPGNLRWATQKQQCENRRPRTEWLRWGSRTGKRS
jgi:hypothetical protein